MAINDVKTSKNKNMIWLFCSWSRPILRVINLTPSKIHFLILIQIKNFEKCFFKGNDARRKHIHDGNLTRHIAEQISGNRSYSWRTFTQRNTVFEDLSSNYIIFDFCETNNPKNQHLIISRNKVKTFQCTKKWYWQTWDTKFIGSCYAIFDTDLHYVGHFFNNGDIDF